MNDLCVAIIQNIGLGDGGVIKGKTKPGLRDTNVDPVDFGPHLPANKPGMIDAANPVQFGHYPDRGAGPRYDDVGPHFAKRVEVATFDVPEGSFVGQTLTLQLPMLKSIVPYQHTLTDGQTPGTKVSVELLEPGKEWCGKGRRNFFGRLGTSIRRQKKQALPG